MNAEWSTFLPSPQSLLDRWRSVALVESLTSDGSAIDGLFSFDCARPGQCVGRFNSYDPEGGFAWIVASGSDIVYYGGSYVSKHLLQNGKQIEKRGRASLKEECPHVFSLLPKEVRGSYGWDFAFIGMAGKNEWRKLVPVVRSETVSFKNDVVLYGKIKECARWMCEQFEIPNGMNAVDMILRNVPLSCRIVKNIVPNGSCQTALHKASSMGYPIEAGFE